MLSTLFFSLMILCGWLVREYILADDFWIALVALPFVPFFFFAWAYNVAHNMDKRAIKSGGIRGESAVEGLNREFKMISDAMHNSTVYRTSFGEGRVIAEQDATRRAVEEQTRMMQRSSTDDWWEEHKRRRGY